MPGLTKRALDAAKPRNKDYFIWCGSTPGFGVRVHPSGRKVFVAQVRVGRAIRRVRIGPYGPFTVDQARQRAEEIVRMAPCPVLTVKDPITVPASGPRPGEITSSSSPAPA